MRKTAYPRQFGGGFRFGQFGHVGYLSAGAAKVLTNLALRDAVKSGAACPLDGDTWVVLARCEMPQMLYDKEAPTV